MTGVKKSIFEYFESYAAECDGDLFLFDEEKRYSVEETIREAVTIGNRLHDFGVRPENLVALRCTRSLDACQMPGKGSDLWMQISRSPQVQKGRIFDVQKLMGFNKASKMI